MRNLGTCKSPNTSLVGFSCRGDLAVLLSASPRFYERALPEVTGYLETSTVAQAPNTGVLEDSLTSSITALSQVPVISQMTYHQHSGYHVHIQEGHRIRWGSRQYGPQKSPYMGSMFLGLTSNIDRTQMYVDH